MRWIEHQAARRREVQPDLPQLLAHAFLNQAAHERRRDVCLVTSEHILDSLEYQLTKSGAFTPSDAKVARAAGQTLVSRANRGILLREVKHLPEIDEDVEDQLVYSAAVQGRAQILVTFDRRFRDAVADSGSPSIAAVYPKRALELFGFALPITGGAPAESVATNVSLSECRRQEQAARDSYDVSAAPVSPVPEFGDTLSP